MTERRPLVRLAPNGIAELPVGDSLPGSGVTGVDGRTGMLRTTAGVLAINANPALIDIQSVPVQVIDDTTFPPTVSTVTYPGANGVTVTNLATAVVTTFYINAAGALVQDVGNIFGDDRRLGAFIGFAVHADNVSISEVGNTGIRAQGHASEVDDVYQTLGDRVEDNGGVYGASGANLLLARTAATYFGARIGPLTNPSYKDIPANLAITTYLRTFRSATPGMPFLSAGGSAIDPNVFDDGLGVESVVTNNRYTIKRLVFDPRTILDIIELGQTDSYTTLAAARAGISTDSVIRNPALSRLALRGWLIIQQGVTDIEAALIAGDALFVLNTGELAQGTGFGTDPNAFHNNVPGEIAALATVSAASGDTVFINDSSDSNNPKAVDLADLIGGTPAVQALMVLTDSGTRDMNAAATDNVMPWNLETVKDAGFTHDNVTNPSRIEVDETSTYLVTAQINSVGDPIAQPRYQGEIKLRLNGSAIVGPPVVSGYARFNEGVDFANMSGTWAVKLTAGDYVEVLVDRLSDRLLDAQNSVPNKSSFHIFKMTGESGPAGPTGPGGNDPNAIHNNVAMDISNIALATAVAGDKLIINQASTGGTPKSIDVSDLLGGGGGDVTVLTINGLGSTAPSPATDTLIAGSQPMTITPAEGTYIVWFSFDAQITNSISQATFSIYAGGVQASETEVRLQTLNEGIRWHGQCVSAHIVVNGAEAVEARVRTGNAGADVVEIRQRRMVLLKVDEGAAGGLTSLDTTTIVGTPTVYAVTDGAVVKSALGGSADPQPGPRFINGALCFALTNADGAAVEVGDVMKVATGAPGSCEQTPGITESFIGVVAEAANNGDPVWLATMGEATVLCSGIISIGDFIEPFSTGRGVGSASATSTTFGVALTAKGASEGPVQVFLSGAERF